MSSKQKRERQAEDDLLDWFTVSYRTIYIGLGLVIACAAAGGYYCLPVQPSPASPSPSWSPATGARFSLMRSVKSEARGTFEWVSAEQHGPQEERPGEDEGRSSSAEITF
jgi:hypothetical protein